MINKQFERKNVKPLRKALGWTQAQMAIYLGVSPTFTVQSWENLDNVTSIIRNVNSEKLWELAKKYKIKF